MEFIDDGTLDPLFPPLKSGGLIEAKRIVSGFVNKTDFRR